jgi:hypothetical protein
MNDFLIQVDHSFEDQLQYLVSEHNSRIERTLLSPATPNEERKFNIRRFRKKREIFSLAIYSWYLSEGGILLREDLRDVKMSTLRDQEILSILLRSKSDMLNYLGTYSGRNIFGNWLPTVKQTAEKLNFCRFQPHRVRRIVRRRGYRDHGSCRSQSRWLPTFDLSWTEEMIVLETEKDFRNCVQDSIKTFGALGVRLPEFEVS